MIQGLLLKLRLTSLLIGGSAALLFSLQTQALPGDYLVKGAPAKEDFALVGAAAQADIYIDSNDYPGLQRAVKSLQQDIQNVSGRLLKSGSNFSSNSKSSTLLIIGSLGKSALLDQLVSTGKLDVSAIAGRWEAYQIQLLQNPLPGVEQALVIAGSDKRGAIFGVYDVAETIGVSPWHWWADVPVAKSPSLYIKADTFITDAPKVKYRGIFLNDEHPALSNWVAEKFGSYNHQFYQQVFELLLRLKANFLWPAMWNNAFADDDPKNMLLADEMGIVMSNSHHEPMMRADKEWNRYGKGPWEYSSNRDHIYKFWQDGAKRHQHLESIFTLGMRGQEDEPMSEGENIGLLEQIVADQRQILKDTFNDRPVSDVPQVWALYKEVQGFYERGMRVPDDVTLLWADDNFGNIRRLPTKDERARQGGAGVYYHFDYVGNPREYRWINTVPLAKIWEQMDLAWRFQADRIWIVNVGDLKPMEFPTDFFLRMAWDPTGFNADNLQQFASNWAAQQFGAPLKPEHANTIARLLQGYSHHNGRRKPEAVEPDTYSIFHYGEAERVSAELAEFIQASDALEPVLAEKQRDAYVQLVSHPLKASRAMFEHNRAVAMNRLHGEQGRASTNYWAAQVKFWFDEDARLTDLYHKLGNGRWNHMMSQPHLGYTYWRNPDANLMPVVAVATPQPVADMGVMAEGSALSWPISEYQGKHLRLLPFYPQGQRERQLEIFNKGTTPFEFKATASKPWITLSQQSGSVSEQQTIAVSIDWDKAEAGENVGEVDVQGTGWGGAKINVTAHKTAARTGSGFVDADGYIALDAASGKMLANNSKRWWQQVPGLGRGEAAMVAMTELDYQVGITAPDIQQSAALEYPLLLNQAGTFTLNAIISPTLDLVPGRGLRFAVAINDEPPQLVDTLKDHNYQVWEQAVLNGVRTVQIPLHFKQPGAHKLRIYLVDPALVLQKLILDTGGLQPSYLGPPQSPYLNADIGSTE
ncbi:glycosyl hydrolase [Rheinheimera riviphila]|uniref:Glycosyl hydrolase n=1 Tax=Rheinheimera riviphila TaxID=1834037 RepID=A0A437R038_9GAMM|nr:glycosyl hydrolase 115 family protein [Rheinheimera riviphila]RVU40156.1 glycosyl hydrolase [Rheinheimera riviphila]